MFYIVSHIQCTLILILIGRTSETPLSVIVNKFNFIFNPWDTLIQEEYVQFQQYISVNTRFFQKLIK